MPAAWPPSDLGLYVHVPFCAASCPYCDYPHAVAPSAETHAAFVDALCTEIRRRGPHHDAPVRTIYLGGGTPSRLSGRHVERVFAVLHEAFDCTGVCEVTAEANPDDLRGVWLEAIRAAGVDRLSLGVQSFSGEDLRFLGRRHDAAQAARAIPAARAAGIQNASLDLIFGLPGQAGGRWQDALERALGQAPSHVTLYRLTAEAGTPLGRRVAAGRVELPVEDAVGAQYERALAVLEAGGLRLYEQTHLARPGAEAKHTPRHWRHAPVLGFGPGAHSFWWKEGRAMRRANAPDERAYVRALADGCDAPHVCERHAPEELAAEYVAQRLRTARGLSPERLARCYGRDLHAERGPTLDRLRADGYLERHGQRLRPTRAGRLRLDALTAALL